MLLESDSQRRLQIPGHLQVQDFAAPDWHTLMRFNLAPGQKRGWSTGLEFLGGDLHNEFWQMNMPAASGGRENVVWRRCGGLMFLAYERPDDGSEDVSAIACSSYKRMLDVAMRHGCNWPVRAWNYMPLINAGDGDSERYRQFCRGRAEAMDAAGVISPRLCASTAIGGEENLLRIFLLCSDSPATNIENPRQISAYHYPREYGPRGPSFARATALHNGAESVLLMISGTASVVGHATLHVGDVSAQLEETIFNLGTMLSTSRIKLGAASAGSDGFDQHSLLKVYVRHAEHWPLIEARLLQEWPNSRFAGLRGDLCRAELLVEVEAVTRI